MWSSWVDSRLRCWEVGQQLKHISRVVRKQALNSQSDDLQDLAIVLSGIADCCEIAFAHVPPRANQLRREHNCGFGFRVACGGVPISQELIGRDVRETSTNVSVRREAIVRSIVLRDTNGYLFRRSNIQCLAQCSLERLSVALAEPGVSAGRNDDAAKRRVAVSNANDFATFRCDILDHSSHLP